MFFHSKIVMFWAFLQQQQTFWITYRPHNSPHKLKYWKKPKHLNYIRTCWNDVLHSYEQSFICLWWCVHTSWLWDYYRDPLKMDCAEFCGSVHTTQRQTSIQIPISSVLLLSVSVSVSVSVWMNHNLPCWRSHLGMNYHAIEYCVESLYLYSVSFCEYGISTNISYTVRISLAWISMGFHLDGLYSDSLKSCSSALPSASFDFNM